MMQFLTTKELEHYIKENYIDHLLIYMGEAEDQYGSRTIYYREESTEDYDGMFVYSDAKGYHYVCMERRNVGINRSIRKDLEHDGIQILCNGAARNVYPSPMMLNMGEGRSAYKVTLGHQALMKDVVDIFDYDESLICCSVEEQNQYYSNWVTSLRRR